MRERRRNNLLNSALLIGRRNVQHSRKLIERWHSYQSSEHVPPNQQRLWETNGNPNEIIKPEKVATELT